ncbi:MAG: alpha/beta hydrolase fold protein [Rhodoglobus sp.]|nr:alpha/beta hydrolase fold protein [Rhodoglobus sp.]
MTRTDVTATNGPIELAGSIWTPDAREPAALILMYPGSGPSDRDNDVFFPPIREALLGAGAAVASFDKRGVGGSGGDWLEAGIRDQADDLVAFLAVARAAVPGVPVGLFGHSQGGWVVLEAAAETEADFVITSSGPSVTPRVQEEYSTRENLARLNLDEAETAAIMASYGELFDRAGETYESVANWMAEPERAPHFEALESVGAFVPDGPVLWTFAGLIMDYDPAAALSALEVPLLAVLGAADNVVPVEASAEGFRRTVKPELLALRVLDGGDHRLQNSDTEEFVPDYLPALVEFVTGR